MVIRKIDKEQFLSKQGKWINKRTKAKTFNDLEDAKFICKSIYYSSKTICVPSI